MIIPPTVPFGLYHLFIIGVLMRFQVANCNGFYFNASPLGLKPDGALYLSMILYDPRTETYVNNNASICLWQDVDIQILYSLFSLMSAVQPNLQYRHECCFHTHAH